MSIRPRVEGDDQAVFGDKRFVAKGDRNGLIKAIITWIPVEVIGVYKFAIGFVPMDYPSWRIGLTLLLLVMTPLWIAFATKSKTKKNTAWRQVLLSPFAFAFWICAIQPDVIALLVGGWQTWMGSVIL